MAFEMASGDRMCNVHCVSVNYVSCYLQTPDAIVRRSMAGVFGIAAAAASQTGDSSAIANAVSVLVHYITLGHEGDARHAALDLR